MRILVVGDAMLDEFVLCEPGTSSGGLPILIERERVYRPGGAAAVACVAQGLGAEVRLFAPIGDDLDGAEVDWQLAQRISLRGESDATTTRKTRIRCTGRDEIRIDRNGTARKYARPVHDDIAHADAVILADYAHGALDAAERQRIIRLCDSLGAPCVVGAARGVAWSEYDGATVISATVQEAWSAGYPSGPRAIYCLTYGRDGLRIVAHGQTHHACRTAIEVDSLGCGDSACAALAVGLAERMPLPALADFCAAVGAAQASKGPGAWPVSRAEIAAATA